LKGPLRIPALDFAINRIRQRHEALRARFEMTDDLPIQIISAPARDSIPLIDLQSIAPGARDDEARQIMRRLSITQFDLTRGPLFRAVLMRLADDDHSLMFVTHHIVFDGWSVGVFLRELSEFYKEQLTGETAELGELTVQYPDYACWQREWLKGEVLDRQLDYWKRRLKGMSRLTLPVDYSTPASRRAPALRRIFMIPRLLGNELKVISQREGVTLFITVLTAFKILLSRWTGQKDIPVGAVLACRDRQDIEGLIGFFVNTVVMRTDLSGNPTFAESLRRVRETALGAYAHQDVPFEKVVQLFRPKRDSGRNPLFR
jgi:hypothetical protein